MIKMERFRRKAKVSLAAALIFAQAAGFQSLPVHAATTGTVTCSVLNVRSGGSTNDPVITTVSKGTKLDIISSENGWYEISINGTTGYVSAEYVSTDGSGSIAVSGQSGSVNVSVLNLRSGASTDSSVVGALYMGDTVSITESNNGWYGVTTASGAKGYVYAQYITLGSSGSSSDTSNGNTSTSVTPASGEGTCNTSALNVRSDASTSASVIGLIRYGTKVTITGTAGAWYQVTTTVNGSSVTGFVHGDYITMGSSGSDSSSDSGSSEVTPASGEGVCNTSALNIRKEATTSSATYGLIRQGTKVTILGKSGDWYQVKTTVNGSQVTGYAHSDYITVSDSSSSDDSSDESTGSVEAASGTGVCNTTALNVRQEASTSSKTLGLIYKDAKVTITGKTGSWYQVKATVNGSQVTGFVYKDYITLSDDSTSTSDDPTVSEVNETVWATTAVNVRKGCGTSYGIIATLRQGASVTRTGVLSNGWSRVDYNGTTAYVSSQYLTTTDPAPDDETPSNGASSGITGVTGEDIAAYALQWKGYPYVWGGNNLSTGVDCSGFTQQVYLHFGISLNRVADAQKQNGIRIASVDQAKPGDLFFYGSSSYADHVAIYIGNGQVIHASSPSVGIIVSNVTYRTPVAIVRVIY